MDNKDLFQEENDLLQAQIEQANQQGESEYGNVKDVKQGTKAWFELRAGKFTGSKYPDLLKGGRGKDERWGLTAMVVIKQVYIERDLTEVGMMLYIDELFNKNFRSTDWGNKYESFAREKYADKTGFAVEETCFAIHPTIPYMGGSFDGKILEQPMIMEIKCPYDLLIHAANVELQDTGLTSAHSYYAQIQGNIEIAGAESCDFVSYDPRRKKDSLVIINVERDQEFINNLINRVNIAEKAVYYMGLSMNVADAILLAENDYK